MTFNASQRAYPNYNIMAVAKAALEAEVRYLAYELGPRAIRVNAISAGPVRTLAARSITGFTVMEEHTEKNAPLRRNITAEDVGNAAKYLCSPLAANVTGQILLVDAGYSILGMSLRPLPTSLFGCRKSADFRELENLFKAVREALYRWVYPGRHGTTADADGVRPPRAAAVWLARSRRRWRPAADLQPVLRPLRSLVACSPAAAWRRPWRPCRLHRPEHARAAGVVLRGAPDRRRRRADQLPPDAPTTSPTSSATAAPRSCARMPTTWTPSTASATRFLTWKHFVALEGGARDGWLDYESLLSGATSRVPQARPSTRATC